MNLYKEVQVEIKNRQALRNSLLEDLEAIQQSTEFLVTATPNGEARNKLTEANLHLMAAQAALKEVV